MKTIISGFGCVCALGDNISQITKNLFSLNAEPSFPSDRLSSSYSNQYPVFQVSGNILSKKREDESFSYLFLRTAIDEALFCAGLSAENLKNVRVGVCIGTTVDVSFNCFDFYKNWKQNKNPPLDPLNKYIHYSTAREVIKNYGFANAFGQTVVTACASGTDAIGIAGQWIENGLCDVAIASGCDELNLIPYTGFIKLMIAETKPCKPFDKNRTGINLGEGAGVFIMVSEKFANANQTCQGDGGVDNHSGQGDGGSDHSFVVNCSVPLTTVATHNSSTPKRIGTLLGYGNAADAYHATAPEPNGRGLRKALQSALTESGLIQSGQGDGGVDHKGVVTSSVPLTTKLAFVNAHATGTKDNDAAEAGVFNSLLNGVPISATKSLTGHCLGAAGAVEACLSLICLNEGKIPKTKNFETPDDALSGIVPVSEETKIDKTKAAVSTSLAFGGCNSAIVLKGRAES